MMQRDDHAREATRFARADRETLDIKTTSAKEAGDTIEHASFILDEDR